RFLKKAFTNPHSYAPHIHLSGTPACGILETLKIMEKRDVPEARICFVNCLSIEGCAKSLFSQISLGFYLKRTKNDNIDSLQLDLNQLCEDKNERLIAVLLDAQALNCFTSSFLKAFFDISRKTRNGRFTFVTVSHLPWLHFQREVNSCAAEPVSLIFQVPSQDEIIEKMKENEEEIPQKFLRNCIDHLIPTSNNPNVIKNMISETWSMANKEEWNSASGLKKYVGDLDGKVGAENDWLDSSSSLMSAASKLVLVSSYCASHNHPASDKRYLIKTHNKEKVRANEKRNEATGTPKMFDLERLLFIREALMQLYHHLKNESIEIEPKLLVNSLVSMNRLILVSSKDNLDWPKLKCVTPFETVRQLAQDIGIKDINIHLEY
ncbi:hypothetical protein PENTCL1PPCAC_18007, partial [Pristionchus entomophagus]